ncbi:hypothetical protein D1BOALGB6SA_4330 [Olavius sp. associated proteobacterium Delta 1]|nr:hypothetical protein D1BOALGB6SA_4330 [Olavius sp. associated proteobacterium Delta 1]
MCQSYKIACTCNQNEAEIFFGKMVLNETAIEEVYCPRCSQTVDSKHASRVWDNDWVLEMNLDVVRQYAGSMGISPQELTAEKVFDDGYATWVGITPDDTQRRNQERDQIQKLAKTDILAYYEAMKEWGLSREKRFSDEGWRKMRAYK